jgi:class 3 adenylate cyclase
VLCRLGGRQGTHTFRHHDLSPSTVRYGPLHRGRRRGLPKPFNPIPLRARIGASVEVRCPTSCAPKRSSGRCSQHPAVDRQRCGGETVIADRIPDATFFFRCRRFTARRSGFPGDVALLADIFCRSTISPPARSKDQDHRRRLHARRGFQVRTDHAVAVAEMALAMLDAVENAGRIVGERLQLRIGLNTGALIAGVLGTHKFVYDVWGDTVNTAKRMESYGLPGHVHVSAATRQALGDAFRFEPRTLQDVKGKGSMQTFLLHRKS